MKLKSIIGTYFKLCTKVLATHEFHRRIKVNSSLKGVLGQN